MIKVDIISGFLGAGKTTLISKLLKEKLNKENVVLIENEFGEIGIDGGFLKDSGIIINEMNSGCICCSLVGDFEKSLQEVIDTYNPDRIIIEPSGVGKLSDIIKAVKKIEGLDINIYSTVVDVLKAKIYSRNFKDFFNDQIKTASCILLSKTQNAKEEKIKESINIIKELNPNAKVVTTPWDKLTTDDLLNVMESNTEIIHTHNHCDCKHNHCHHHDHHNHAEDTFISLGYETINKYSKEELYDILSNLDENILRVKGMVLDESDNWLFFDYVPNEINIRKGSPNYTGLISVIGLKDLNEEKIKKVFKL